MRRNRPSAESQVLWPLSLAGAEMLAAATILVETPSPGSQFDPLAGIGLGAHRAFHDAVLHASAARTRAEIRAAGQLAARGAAAVARLDDLAAEFERPPARITDEHLSQLRAVLGEMDAIGGYSVDTLEIRRG
ncbi:hypothetical protein [Amycolatopsis rubida]|nr:hypothetical protein [Amycolatopsis rubida]